MLGKLHVTLRTSKLKHSHHAHHTYHSGQPQIRCYRFRLQQQYKQHSIPNFGRRDFYTELFGEIHNFLVLSRLAIQTPYSHVLDGTSAMHQIFFLVFHLKIPLHAFDGIIDTIAFLRTIYSLSSKGEGGAHSINLLPPQKKIGPKTIEKLV